MDELSVADYAALLVLLLLSAAVGLFHGCKRRTSGDERMREYALAGGKMAVLPIALSLSATVLSGSSMVGVAGEVYHYAGTEYLCFGIGGTIGLIISGILVVPVYRKIQYVSVYEYLERRFDRWMRILFSIIYILAKTMFISVALYVPALALSTLTTFPQWVSVIVSGAICIAYCVIGGMKAVIWTDVLQAFFMVTCNCLLIGFGLYKVGGVQKAWNLAVDGGRIGHVTWLETENTRYSMWSLTLGSVVIFMNAMCAGQAGVQRILAVKGLKEARRATLIGALLVLFFMGLSVLVGLVLYSNYATCDPILRQDVPKVRTPDQVFVYAIGDLLGGYSGLKGLALAGIFSGSLSTFSSYINSFATLTVEDLLPHRFVSTDKRKLLLCKIFTLVYGSLSVMVAFAVPHMGGIIQTSALITGSTGGPLTGVILLGMFSKRSSKKGVVVGLIVGLALTSWIAVGSRLHTPRPKLEHLPQSLKGCPAWNNTSTSFAAQAVNHNKTVSYNNDIWKSFYSISFMWYGPIGLLATLIIGYLASLVSGDYVKDIDQRLFYIHKNINKVPKGEMYLMVEAQESVKEKAVDIS